MSLFTRSVPKEVRSQLERGERVLAHAPVAAPAGESAHLVATTRALYLPGGRAVAWASIDQARWSTEALTFLEEGAGQQTVPLRAGPEYAGGDGVDYRRLAETVSERVTATILANEYVPYPAPDSATGYRLVARRAPGGTDVDWRVHLSEGVDPQDPHLSDAVSRSLAALRQQTGI